jgi:glycosyltransferase involved in cell wall biosynthesis
MELGGIMGIQPKCSVITPSYNKKKYIKDAIDSVLNQTLTDFEYVIVDNSTEIETRMFLRDTVKDTRINLVEEDYDIEFRKYHYIPALILNNWLDKLKGEFIFYLSDDDTIDIRLFDKCVTFLETSGADVCYVGMQSITTKDGVVWVDDGRIMADNFLPKGSNCDCMLDGGCIMVRKTALQQLERPYFTDEWINASHCDGIFLTKLCASFDFHPMHEMLLTHRRTEISINANGLR